MLTDDDKKILVRQFCEEAFVRPNICATISTDEIYEELKFIESGARSDVFAKHPEWQAIIDPLYAEAIKSPEQKQKEVDEAAAAAAAAESAAQVADAKAILSDTSKDANARLQQAKLEVLLEHINEIKAKLGIDPVSFDQITADIAAKIDDAAVAADPISTDPVPLTP